MADEDYRVQLDIFEGPLDLLLYLVKRDEIDLHEISLERLTKQYMTYVDTFQMLRIELASEFIVMAAHLMYVKSRSLLPSPEQAPEEDGDEDGPRWDLIRQLVEYKKFKDAAEYLRTRSEWEHFMLPVQLESIDDQKQREPSRLDTNIFDLIRAFQRVLTRFESSNLTLQIHDDLFTVADKMERVMELIRLPGRLSFGQLFEGVMSRTEVITTFLAMLELIKLSQLLCEQGDPLGEIMLVSQVDR